MIVNSISLDNFRNHSAISLEFDKGINNILGGNAVGKTSVVEAIYYLSLARSFRTNEDDELIKKGKDKSEIYATVSEGELKRKIRVIITKDNKQVLINGKPVSRLSELVKIVNVIVFEPKDVMLFRGSPKVRRSFLDISLSKKSSAYFDYISKYEKILRERNELLKQEKVNKELLESLTELLIKSSSSIVAYRQAYVKDINDILNKITRALTGVNEKFELIYKPFVKYDENFMETAKQAFNSALESDLSKKATTIGVHREDFSIALNGRDIGVYGSQGENRIAALALKLSPYFLIEDKDKRPIIVLDDVMSELDEENRQRLIKFLKRFEQVFITATDLKIDGASHYTIKQKDKEVF